MEGGISNMIQNIGIIGVGGVGGYFGGKLCRSRENRQKVFFLARGPHLDALRKDGLTVKTVSEGTFTCRPALATDGLAELPELDFCLVTVKGFDLEGVTRHLAERVSDTTVILPLLNGIDIDARIRTLLPETTILPGCAYISARIEAPGIVTQTGGPCKIILGDDPRRPKTPKDEIQRLFDAAGINYEWVKDPLVKIWEKFLFIAPFSLVTACFDKTIGEVITSSELGGTVQAIMEEIVRLADAMGISLPEGAVGTAFEKARNFPPDTRTSFQGDFAKPDKNDEREIFGGSILRLCEEKRIDCPATREILLRLNKIKPIL